MTASQTTSSGLAFTGERFLPEVRGAIFFEHWHRYAVTAPLVLFLVLFYPVIRSSSSVTPSTSLRDHELANYGSLVTKLGPWFGMSPEAIARAGPVVVAGLIAIPLAAFAARRLWAALVLGGSVAVLVAVLVPPFFTILADVFSLSQARRLPEFLPVSFAVVGACIALSRFRAWGIVIAGVVSAGLVLLYPGEFTWVYADGGPSWAVWLAIVGGLAALLLGAWRPLWGPVPGRWAPRPVPPGRSRAAESRPGSRGRGRMQEQGCRPGRVRRRCR